MGFPFNSEIRTAIGRHLSARSPTPLDAATLCRNAATRATVSGYHRRAWQMSLYDQENAKKSTGIVPIFLVFPNKINYLQSGIKDITTYLLTS
jgi:hypothetical protein